MIVKCSIKSLYLSSARSRPTAVTVRTANSSFKLSIPRGYYVFAEMSTMADFNVKMMLRDAQTFIPKLTILTLYKQHFNLTKS